jgi:hypothetical protein
MSRPTPRPGLSIYPGALPSDLAIRFQNEVQRGKYT